MPGPRAALVALFSIFLLSSAGASSAAPEGHRPGFRRTRRLLTDCITSEEPCPVQDGTTHVVGGGTLIRECAISTQMYFASTPEEVVPTGGSNLQPTAADCCRSCFQHSPCRVWLYCDRPEGCTPPDAASYAPQQPLPHQGCKLLDVPSFHTLFNNTNEFRFTAEDVQFVAGAPVQLLLPPTAGYNVHPGTDLNNQFDFTCSYSTTDTLCVVVGSASDVAHMCDADLRCHGFTYIPEQSALAPRPLGVLKGNLADGVIPESALAINPSTAVYLKESTSDVPQAATAEATSEGDTHILWVVLPSAVGVAFMVGGMVMCALATRTYHQGKAALAEAAMLTGTPPRSDRSSAPLNGVVHCAAAPGSGSNGSRSTDHLRNGALREDSTKAAL